MFWALQIPFKTGFTVSETVNEKRGASKDDSLLKFSYMLREKTDF
jgi:hypothetical protein